MWYGVRDVEILLCVGQAKAYDVIRELGNELSKTKIPGTDRCYAKPPAGKIQKSFFCEKFMLDKDECEKILNKSQKKAG